MKPVRVENYKFSDRIEMPSPSNKVEANVKEIGYSTASARSLGSYNRVRLQPPADAFPEGIKPEDYKFVSCVRRSNGLYEIWTGVASISVLKKINRKRHGNNHHRGSRKAYGWIALSTHFYDTNFETACQLARELVSEEK